MGSGFVPGPEDPGIHTSARIEYYGIILAEKKKEATTEGSIFCTHSPSIIVAASLVYGMVYFVG